MVSMPYSLHIPSYLHLSNFRSGTICLATYAISTSTHYIYRLLSSRLIMVIIAAWQVGAISQWDRWATAWVSQRRMINCDEGNRLSLS